MFKLGIFTDEVSQDFQVAVDIALEYGLDGLEIRSVWDNPPQSIGPEDRKRMKEILDGTGLEVCSIASPFFKCDIDSDDEYKEHIQILRNCIDLAHSFDCRVVRGFTFWRKGFLKDNMQRIVDKFEEPVKILEAEDIALGIENEASTMIGIGRNLATFFDELNSPYVGSIWDPANCISDTEEETPYPDGYEEIRDKMVHMHVKDARKDPATNEVECTPIGEGDIDFRGQFKALNEDGYEGYASLETHWRPVKLSEEELNRPGGSKFSESGEYASRVCLDGMISILKGLSLR